MFVLLAICFRASTSATVPTLAPRSRPAEPTAALVQPLRRLLSNAEVDAILGLLKEHAERDFTGLQRLSVRQLSAGIWRLARVRWPAEDSLAALGSDKERETLRLAARASVLASASYSAFGALLVSWSPLRLIATAWRLLWGVRRLHETAFDIHARPLGLRSSDLLHAQWRPRREEGSGGPYTPAHYIVVDHAERAVVLVVRGSLDLSDVLTDLQVQPSRREEGLLGRGCHGGMARAALCLAEAHEGLLRRALREHRGYRLQLVGHSLGGGIASFAALLLRRRLRGVDVRAFAFAPPCTLPLRESARHDARIDSFVYASDVVPRLSIGSLQMLVDGVKLAQAKAQGNTADGAADDRLLERHLLRCLRRPHQNTRYPPGRLHQLVRVRRGEHQLRRLRRRDLALLRMHRSMFRDHGFDRYQAALAGLTRDVACVL